MSNYKMNKAKSLDKEKLRKEEEIVKKREGVEKVLIRGNRLIANVEDVVDVSEEFLENLKKKIEK